MERGITEQALVVLGDTLRAYLQGESVPGRFDFRGRIDEAIAVAGVKNPWFTADAVKYCLGAWAKALQPEKIDQWMARYPLLNGAPAKRPKTVAVVAAGNIPMVGMHDMISVLLSGNTALIKLSESDKVLLPLMFAILTDAQPDLNGKATFTTDTIKDFDAVIATGSDNTNRYFEYYFGKYPNLLRKNRNSVAVLTGNESLIALDELCQDLFLYYGMGCRSVSKLYVPKGYDFDGLLTLFNVWDHIGNHHRYRNNYDYHKSIMMINKIPFLSHRNALIARNEALGSPLSVIHYEEYTDIHTLSEELARQEALIQCVASSLKITPNAVPLGTTQEPELWDYADGTDTLLFLQNLPKA